MGVEGRGEGRKRGGGKGGLGLCSNRGLHFGFYSNVYTLLCAMLQEDSYGGARNMDFAMAGFESMRRASLGSSDSSVSLPKGLDIAVAKVRLIASWVQRG